MVAPLSDQEFKSISKTLEELTGISLNDQQSYLVEVRLSELARSTESATFTELLQKAKSSPDDIMPKLIDFMTTNETSWFRDQGVWAWLESNLIPDLVDKLHRNEISTCRIWSAACSTGQELYTTKILIHECLESRSLKSMASRFELLGTDISDSSLYLARQGVYNKFSMIRGMPENLRDKYFEPATGSSWKVSEELRMNTRFEKHNLKQSFAKFGSFHLVFCRNVMIYFTDAFRTELLKSLHRSLAPDGVFFTGSSENVQRYNQDLKQVRESGVIYYV